MSAQELCYDVPQLMQQFESLGENCDLGVVQRAVGLETFGLFRFAACDAAGLATLLRARFETLCAPGDLWLDVVGLEREYWVKSKNCCFEAHTNRYADRDAATVVLQGELEKMRHLTAHLLRDLSRGNKLCVFKGESDLDTIRDLETALRSHGPNCLLWVKTANDQHAPGVVERNSPGLLLGYVSRYGTYHGDPSLPVEEWVSVCANAYRLWRHEDAPRVQCENLLSSADSVQSCLWAGDPSTESRRYGHRYEHRLGSDEPTVVCRAQLPIARGSRLTFSIWVRIPQGSSLRMINLLLSGFETVATWGADLKSLGYWQRIWLAAEVPESAHTVACDLIAAGPPGTEFESANWCLERGTRPSGYGFAL